VGINKEAIYLINKWKDLKQVESFLGVRVCELGNQHIRHELVQHNTGKSWFASLGAEHVSVDINGEDGSLPMDLSRPLPEEWRESFDLVTNFGTSEHVVGQYQLFKNIHDILKVGGCWIHCVPRRGSYPTHSPFKYEAAFFSNLSKFNGYIELLLKDVKRRKGKYQVCAILEKATNSEFISECLFTKLEGITHEST